MPWPAYLLREAPAGTCYIRGRQFPDVLRRHQPRGQAWKYDNAWTTYVPKRDLAFKNLDRFYKPDEQQRKHFDEDFWQLLDECRAAGINPPTSFADIFMSVFKTRLPLGSAVAPFYGAAFGGWEVALFRGEWTHGRVYQYDINRAYRWAACAGLPDLRSSYPTRDFTKPLACYVLHVPFNVIPWKRSGGVCIVTSEERDALKIQSVSGVRVLYGVAFRRTIDLTPTFVDLDRRFPLAAKRVGQRFWSMWNTTRGPEQWSWRNGEKTRLMRNPFYNPIWAAFVTSRIKLRLNLFREQSLRIYVDSIITPDPDIPTSDEIGAFKLVGAYDHFWIRHPGYWGDGEHTVKHSGASLLPSWVTE